MCVAFVSRIFIFTVALITSFLIGTNPNADTWESPIPFVNLFARWDTAYYAHIANYGYSEDIFWAFPPLYPLLMRILNFFIPFDISLVGFILSNALFFGFVLYFYKLTAKIFGPKISFLSTALVSFFPSSIFFSAVYAESLFLFLTVLSFYFFENRQTSKSVGAGFLAGLTKPFGFLSGLIHLFNGIVKRSKKQILSGLIIFSSILVFFLLGFLFTDNLFVFFDVKLKYWDAGIFNNPLYSFTFLTLFQKIMLVFIVGLSATALIDFFKNRKWYSNKQAKYYVFFIVLFLFYLNSPLESFTRFALAFMPIFWYLAKIWGSFKKTGWVIFLLFGILNVYSTSLFVNWYYFY